MFCVEVSGNRNYSSKLKYHYKMNDKDGNIIEQLPDERDNN